MTDLPIVDAHHHYWDLSLGRHPWLCEEPPVPFRYGDYRALRRSYLPADYEGDVAGQHVVAGVHVEAEWDPADPAGETRWLETILPDEPRPQVIVGRAFLDRADVEEVLAAHAAASPRLRGIRHKPRAAERPDAVERGAPGSMGHPAWRAGYRLLADFGLHFELQTPWWHLYEAADLAAAFPETPLIVNHTGLPGDRSPEGLRAWAAAMRAVAALPNVCCKISGLGHATLPWAATALRPIVRETISIFGVGRCMFASNYPVDSLTAGFDTIFSGFREMVADLPEAEQRALFHDNALRIYRIPQPAG